MPEYDILVAAVRYQVDQVQSLSGDWIQETNQADLVTLAEAHSVSPMLYQVVTGVDEEVPRALKRELQALYLRHRHASQVRMAVVQAILAAYATANIEVVLLKGFALAHLVYDDPALRPMRDVDLLVAPEQAIQAQTILADLGFQAPLPQTTQLPSKHLEAATIQRDGLTVSIEVHHNAFHDDFYASLDMHRLSSKPLRFQVGEIAAQTLGYEDMLWHLCGHIVNIAHPVKLIWISDIVRFAETFAAEIDWELVRQKYANILQMLSLFHTMMPLSAQLRQVADLKVGPVPQGVGHEFQGWPRYSLRAQRHKGVRGILCDTFFPPEWWLRLYYSLGSAKPIRYQRWVGHPLHILGFGRQLLREWWQERQDR